MISPFYFIWNKTFNSSRKSYVSVQLPFFFGGKGCTFAPSKKIKNNQMKTILLKAVFVIAVFISVTPALAAGNADPIVSQLKRQIKFPEGLKTEAEDAVVYVSFTVDTKGVVNIISMNASHPDASRDVIAQLNHLRLKTADLTAGEVYYVKINFKLIS